MLASPVTTSVSPPIRGAFVFGSITETVVPATVPCVAGAAERTSVRSFAPAKPVITNVVAAAPMRTC